MVTDSEPKNEELTAICGSGLMVRDNSYTPVFTPNQAFDGLISPLKKRTIGHHLESGYVCSIRNSNQFSKDRQQPDNPVHGVFDLRLTNCPRPLITESASAAS